MKAYRWLFSTAVCAALASSAWAQSGPPATYPTPIPRTQYPGITALVLDYPNGGEVFTAPYTINGIAHPILTQTPQNGGACGAYGCFYANISHVTFYVNDIPVCSAYSMLYSCAIHIQQPGTYKIDVAIFDSFGNGYTTPDTATIYLQ